MYIYVLPNSLWQFIAAVATKFLMCVSINFLLHTQNCTFFYLTFIYKYICNVPVNMQTCAETFVNLILDQIEAAESSRNGQKIESIDISRSRSPNKFYSISLGVANNGQLCV